MTDTVEIRDSLGPTGLGNKAGAVRSVRARVQKKRRRARTAAGVDVTSDATVYLPMSETFSMDAKFVVDGREREIMEVRVHRNLATDSHQEVLVG